MKFNAPTCTKQKYSVAYGICVNYIKKPLLSLNEVRKCINNMQEYVFQYVYLQKQYNVINGETDHEVFGSWMYARGLQDYITQNWTRIK